MELFDKSYQNSEKALTRIAKDLRRRDQEQAKGFKTFAIETDIRSAFSSLDVELGRLQQMSNKYAGSPERFGLSQSQADNIIKKYKDIEARSSQLKSKFQSLFALKTKPDMAISDRDRVFAEKYDITNLSEKQIMQLKLHEEQQQEEMIDDLIHVVGNVSATNKAIGNELQEQEVIIDDLNENISKNTNAMSRTRAKMLHLVEESSNCCLYVIIAIQLVAIAAILIFL